MMSTYSLVLLSCVIFLLQSSFLPFLFNFRSCRKTTDNLTL